MDAGCRRPRSLTFVSVIGAALITASILSIAPAADTARDCRVGAYRLEDRSLVVIDPTVDNTLRWRRFDGTTGALHRSPDGAWKSTRGWTGRADGITATFRDCAVGDITFGAMSGHRIDFDVTETIFDGAGVKLAGGSSCLKRDGPIAIVVLVHGSEKYSGRTFYTLQRILPAEGVGVFVYDKRGTGESTGRYTGDFSVLADDAAAALIEARRLAGGRAGRVGFEGGSQGGWVAPLAATKTRADFVIVGFGLAISPLEEDREEIVLEMKAKGHSSTEIAHALEIANAAGTVMSTGFTKGFDRFDSLRAEYRSAPWYKDLHGNFTIDLLPYSQAELQIKADEFLVGTPWHYDSMSVLRRLRTPQLWILGVDDLDAPSAETSHRLKTLRGAVSHHVGNGPPHSARNL